jgi:formate hydrogenlyase subunit 3/multisubunit Na+/H+ antiporter MnhD subunit
VVTVPLLVGALAVWAAGGVVDLAVGPSRLWARSSSYLAGLAGGVLTCAVGVSGVLGTARVVDLGSSLGTGPATLRIDALAGLFLTLVGALAAILSACALSWARPPGRITSRGSATGYLLLLAAVVVVTTAGDAFTFLFGWEGLTAAFYVVSAVARRDGTEVRASWVTLGVGKVSGAALLVGFLLLAGAAGSFGFASWGSVGPGALRDAAWTLIVVGFGAKVGILPFQVWMPLGYPAAQGPIRAAMAGLAANVGFYGLWRFLGILGPPPYALVVAVLVVGGLTALVGIAFATVQSRLPRLVAYSSIENAGIILVGYGIAMAGAATGDRELTAVGLLAASLQVLAHAVAKSVLFSASAFVESGEGTDHLDELSGVGYRYRWEGASFAAGCLTLAGLPPTIGFVSEWYILEALMQEYRVHDLALRLGLGAGGALVALTAGVASLCFIRLVGLTVLRRPSDGHAMHSQLSGHEGHSPPGGHEGHSPPGGPEGHSPPGGHEGHSPPGGHEGHSPPGGHEGHSQPAGLPGRAGLAVLGLACFALAAVAPLVVRFLADGLGPVVPPAPSKRRACHPGCSSRCSARSRSSRRRGSMSRCRSPSPPSPDSPWPVLGAGCSGSGGCRRGAPPAGGSRGRTATAPSPTPTSCATSSATCSGRSGRWWWSAAATRSGSTSPTSRSAPPSWSRWRPTCTDRLAVCSCGSPGRCGGCSPAASMSTSPTCS